MIMIHLLFILQMEHSSLQKLISIVSFSNVIETKSYQEGRLYSCKYPPKRAMQFLISGQPTPYKKSEKCMPTKDLVGEKIRMKIKEIGTLWRNSPNNPQIDVEVLENWSNLIEEWIADKDMSIDYS